MIDESVNVCIFAPKETHGCLYSLLKRRLFFWDEPEANLNPKLASKVVKILLELQRMGTQVFIATHDYVLLKELELESDSNKDDILYHALHIEDGRIDCQTVSAINEINHNAIRDTFDSLLVRSIGNNWED